MTTTARKNESATVTIRHGDGTTTTYELEGIIKYEVRMEAEPVETPPIGLFRNYVSGPNIATISVTGPVRSAIRNPGAQEPAE